MYHALRMIMRDHAPELSEHRALETQIPTQEQHTDWFVHIQRVITYCEQCVANNRDHNRYERLLLALNHLHPSWQIELKRACLADVVPPRYNRINKIPIDLYLTSLPITLARKAKELGIRPTFEEKTKSSTKTSEPPSIHQVTDSKQGACLICESETHQVRACPILSKSLGIFSNPFWMQNKPQDPLFDPSNRISRTRTDAQWTSLLHYPMISIILMLP